MGYDFHITRANSWSENEGQEISQSEWHKCITADPDLQFAEYNGPDFVFWKGHPEDDEAWLDWNEGNIFTKNPDQPLLAKMLEIATSLDANVQGDDGEKYEEARLEQDVLTPTIWGNASLLALLLSFVVVVMFSIAFPLDASVRKEHPVGNPLPLMWGLAIVVPTLIGVFAWFFSVVFAVAAFFFRQGSLRFAAIALVINTATGMYLVLTK